jgi:hypothetical protein
MLKRNVILRDILFVYTIVLLISFAEGHDALRGRAGHSIFKVIFEVVSAFGNVGFRYVWLRAFNMSLVLLLSLVLPTYRCRYVRITISFNNHYLPVMSTTH